MIEDSGSRWTVLEKDFEKSAEKSQTYSFCKCKCGTVRSVRLDTVLNGISKSCGCLAREMASKPKSHGFTKHPCWRAYYDMVRRCYHPTRKDFKHYGGKGIGVEPVWYNPETWDEGLGFLQFLNDMGEKPLSNSEIERFDNSKNYGPDNCYWEDRRAQTNNTSQNNFIEYRGYKLTLSQWSHLLGMRSQILCDRITGLGWSVEKALTTPPQNRGKNFKGSSSYRGIDFVLDFLENGVGLEDSFSKSIFKRVTHG